MNPSRDPEGDDGLASAAAPARVSIDSTRAALVVYLVLFLAFTFPYWLNGDVIAPFDPSRFSGSDLVAQPRQVENTRFSDFAFEYLPTVLGTSYRPQSRWLGLWNAQNELGRPFDHLWGLSPAYFPSWLIANVADGPYRFLTVVALGTSFLAGVFTLLLCGELGLRPLAGLVAACCLVSSPYFMYWLTFPMFVAPHCWSAAMLYALTRLARRIDLRGWALLAFSSYSLLMTGYQQYVVYEGYVIAAYAGHLLWQHAPSGSANFPGRLRWLTAVASAVATGVAAASPAYFDLVFNASQSARLAPDVDFYLARFPALHTMTDVYAFIASSTFPQFLGNPISQSFPVRFDGHGVSAVTVYLSLVALAARFKNTWGWWLAITTPLALTAAPPLYVFGIQHLGFHLSRGAPLAALLVPVTLTTAYGADAVLTRASAGSRRGVLLACAATAGMACVAITFAWLQTLMLRWDAVVIATATIGALAASVHSRRPMLLLAATCLLGATVSFPMALRQHPPRRLPPSPLVVAVRDHLPPDARFAVVAPGAIGILPANLNGMYDVPSLHSYNSLSSRRYHALIAALGGEMQVYGRINDFIQPDFTSLPFWMSNIGVVLSPSTLQSPLLSYSATVGALHLYTTVQRMGCCIQIPFAGAMTAATELSLDPRALAISYPVKIADREDFLELTLTTSGPASGPTLLVLSQKYHRDWAAQVLADTGWTRTRTVAINGVFQGVAVPPGARAVKLQFEPAVRWSFLGHVLWSAALIAVGIDWLRRRATRSRIGAGPRRRPPT